MQDADDVPLPSHAQRMSDPTDALNTVAPMQIPAFRRVQAVVHHQYFHRSAGWRWRGRGVRNLYEYGGESILLVVGLEEPLSLNRR